MTKKEKELKQQAMMEAAAEIGLADKVRRLGWGGLTSRETGRIGVVVKGLKRKGNAGGGDGS
jgi:small acid-soluble spore protein F (minor alpha/beta-type SASP)